VNNAQYAELFLTESREHVSAINHSLLELERGVGGSDAVAAVSAIFRAVHTIKGMSATMGYAAVAELSHELETVLDKVRRDDVGVDAHLMDVLFRSADVLEEAVEAAVAGRDGEVIARDLLAQLRSIGSGQAPAAATPSSWSAPLPGGEGTLVRVRLAPDTPLPGVRAFLIVQALERAATITGMVPAREELQADGFKGEFALRLLTSESSEEIERVVRAAGDVAAVEIGYEDAPLEFTRTASWSIDALQTAEIAVPEPGAISLDPSPSEAPPLAAESTTVVVDAPPKAAEPTPRAAPQRHVRIDLRRLDNLMNLIGELVIARGRLGQLAGDIGDPNLEETVQQTSRLITDIRDEITASRMVPVWQVFDRFPRVVRDAARSVGKQVELTIEGKDIELDRSMLDEIGESIVHLLRNAVDHGIESREKRIAAGKPPVGHLVLSAARDRSAIVIKVSDDGRGIDRQRVLEQAKADGLVDAVKSELSEDEVLRIIARPGFSTAEKVTGLSGRGVGLDAVYTRVRALGGAMNVRSSPGAGTTMVLRLPLTLAIVRALLARVGNETYAIPLAHVSETIELGTEMVRTVKGKEVLLVRDDVLPLFRLRQLVGLPAYTPAGEIDLEQVVVLDLGDRRAALVIDELTAQEEIVVKQYDTTRDSLALFGGATILGDGTPALILDVSSLL
jgi:two-component system chemotaxis sensor kinase CheA